jgi:hypothetical protein
MRVKPPKGEPDACGVATVLGGFAALLLACGLGLFGLGIGMSVDGDLAAALLATGVGALTAYGRVSIRGRVAGAGDWFSPVIWQAFLASSMPSLEIVPLKAQAQWVLDHLNRIEAMSDLTDEQVANLRVWRSRRSLARRELPPLG